jgi:3-deoxy-7-phosphoheptulonate synthase
MDQQLENLNVLAQEVLCTPDALKAELPVSDAIRQSVRDARQAVRNILNATDHRLLVVVGPCSIHDPKAALEYARRLQHLASDVSDTLFVVMRAYFEKPRTTVGWKGLINDPYLNDTFRIEDGLRIARKLLLDISALGLPLSTEALDPITPQYLQDLIAWSAIGARTTESQTHREMASGLSSAVGFKNGTDGGLDVAINALQSVSKPHRFLGINHTGQVAVIHTRGNTAAHLVLRGGNQGPNYDAASVAACERALAAAGLTPNIMIDCSHANSSKDHTRQPLVARDVTRQVIDGNRSIMGLMLESHLHGGNQKLNGEPLRYGVSVTDACIDWDTTAELIRDLHRVLRDPLIARGRTLGWARESAGSLSGGGHDDRARIRAGAPAQATGGHVADRVDGGGRARDGRRRRGGATRRGRRREPAAPRSVVRARGEQARVGGVRPALDRGAPAVHVVARQRGDGSRTARRRGRAVARPELLAEHAAVGARRRAGEDPGRRLRAEVTAPRRRGPRHGRGPLSRRWSGRRESNPRSQFGRLGLYH